MESNPMPALLEKEARSKKIAHLLLFYGGSARDRLESGLRLAQILNCLRPSPAGPCQQCSACLKILSGNHPDVMTLAPLKASIGIEQILSWQEKVYRKHYEAEFKVFLLDRADTLTIPAANALLKVTEEPPERTVIILSAENAEGILPTLRSRAQSYFFPTEKMEKWLENWAETQREEATRAFRLSGKNPDLATAVLKSGLETAVKWLDMFWQVIAEGDFLGLFPLFPLEKEAALIYVQIMAAQIEAGLREGRFSATDLLAVGQALEGLRKQANPRLVIEVLALQLFQ
jgi:DNA polymerase-3 subunit delta'